MQTSKIEQMNCEVATANAALHSVLTQKSEINLDDEGVFPQARVDILTSHVVL